MADVTGWIAERLLAGTVQGAAVIVVVWLVCRRFPTMPAAVQAALWWLTALKLLLVFVPLPTIALPVLPAPLLSEPVALPVPSFVPVAAMVPDAVAMRVPDETSRWLPLVVALWAGALIVQAVWLWRAFRRLRLLVARATPLSPRHAAAASAMARAVGLRRCPEVRLSPEIAAPLVVGIRRPIVLLPDTLPEADWSMALCHEFVHVRRRDLVLGWVPALAERLFFFHPLARLAAREYITAREAACDAGVVRALGIPAGDYGRLLVRLGVVTAEPLPAAGGAPASLTSLRRRLAMLQHSPFHDRPWRYTWVLAAAFVLFLAPFDVTARPAQPALPALPVYPALPDYPPLPPLPDYPELPAVAPFAQAPGPVAPVAPVAPPAPAPPLAPPAPVPPPAPLAEFPFQVDSELRQTLRSIQEQLMQLQGGTNAEAYRQALEQYNELAGQADRAARAQERDSRRMTELFDDVLRSRNAREASRLADQSRSLGEQIESLRVQQQNLERQLRSIAELQRELTEMQRRLVRETERIGNAIRER